MACKLYININGQKKSIVIDSGESSLLTDQETVEELYKELAKTIYYSKEFNDFRKTFIDSIKTSTGGALNVPDLIKQVGFNKIYTVMPNTTVGQLKQRYPNVVFPKSISDDTKIVCGNVRLGGTDLYGMYRQDGVTTYIVKDNEYAVRDLAAYFKVLSEYKDFFTKNHKDYEEISKDTSIKSSVADLFYNYIHGKLEDRVVNGKALSTYFKEAYNQMTQRPDRVEYDTEVVNNIEKSITYTHYGKETIATLKVDTLLLYANSQYPNLIETLKNNNLQYRTNKDGKIDSRDSITIQSIFNLLYKDEPQLQYDVILSGDIIKLKRKFPTVYEYDNIGQDIIDTMNVEEYNGYLIYEKSDGVFYIQKNYLSPNKWAARFTSRESAQQYIDTQLAKDSIYKHCNYDLAVSQITSDQYQKLKSTKTYKKYEIVPIIDTTAADIDSFIQHQDDILRYIKTKSVLEFKQDIEGTKGLSQELKNQIKENTKSAEDVVSLFLARPTIIENILGKGTKLDKFKSYPKANIKYYYITSDYNNEYTIKETQPNSASIRTKRVGPSKQLLLEMIQKEFRTKGISMKILSGEEYKQTIGTSSKAAIKDGIIYLNSELANTQDAFHEYTHLLLGLMKITDYSHYMQLVDKIFQLGMQEDAKTVSEIQSKYKDRSYYDIAEEYFCEKFGQYLNDKIGHNMGLIFGYENKFIRQSAKQLFLFNKGADIKKIVHENSLYSIFMQFNQEARSIMGSKTANDQKKKEFVKQQQSLYRKTSNYIEEQMRDGKITQKCE